MTLDKLKAQWNDNADQYNQWSELGLDEIVAFAQKVEREECAKLVELLRDDWMRADVPIKACAAEYLAEKIRERSKGSLPLMGG